MAFIRLQGEKEKKEGFYYEFDDTSRPLGEGGMGKVFRGRKVTIHNGVSRDVAIKFMFAGLPKNVIQRAENEASIHIYNDNLLEMMGFLAVENVTPDGGKVVRYHVVSELLIGVPLSELIQGVVTDQNGVPIPYAEELYKLYNTSPEQFAVTVIKKILSGVMALHDAGYIHRDIDPSNIIVTRDGKIKIIDFGIAKKVDGLKTHDRNLTTAGQFMGKPQYAAPELIIGDLKNQNKPTDIYSIGILLFQLITGHLPFGGPSNVILNSHLRDRLPLKQIEDRNLRRIVERATEKNCNDRYQSAAEFRAEVDSLSYSKPKKVKNNILAISALALVLLVIIGISIFFSRSESGSKDNTEVVVENNNETVNGKNELTVGDVRRQLLNPNEASEGLTNLQLLVDAGNTEAKFILSRLYAVSSGSFTLKDEYVTMQANMRDRLSPDPRKAHQLLKEIINLQPSFYPALYELACDYYEGAPLSGDEQRDLRKAKELLDQAYDYAAEAEDIVYTNKVSALLRKY